MKMFLGSHRECGLKMQKIGSNKGAKFSFFLRTDFTDLYNGCNYFNHSDPVNKMKYK